MLVLVAGLVFFVWGEPRRCGGFEFAGEIRHYAVATNTVYVATEDRLYQLSHDLRLIQSMTQRGRLEKAEGVEQDRFQRVSGGVDATFSVTVLLPYAENNTLVTCGLAKTSGYCEVLDLRNISNVVYGEIFQMGSPWYKSASVAFLVNVQKTQKNETYILSAVEQCNLSKSYLNGENAVTLHNTNYKQSGDIFSITESTITAVIKTGDNDVEFVDGFQVGWVIYLFSNLRRRDKNNKVRLIWLEGKENKKHTLQSVRGATLTVPEANNAIRLLASSVVPGGPQVLWAGVFSGGGGETQLLLFDISPDLTILNNADPDFCVACPNNNNNANHKVSTRKAEDCCPATS